MLRNYSIKQRLIGSGIILVAGLVMILGLKMYQANQVAELSDARLLVEQMNTEVLMLRRREKDFMLRGDPSYLARFEANMSTLRGYARNLTGILEQQGIETRLLNTFERNLDEYETQFGNYVSTSEQIGLDPESGLYGEMRAAASEIEDAVSTLNNASLQVELLLLRRHEKDFMLRGDLEYVERFRNQARNFSVPASARSSFNNYVAAFNAYVEGQQTLGLDETQGVKGVMRGAVHETETNLESLDEQLVENLQARQTQLEVIVFAVFLLIMAIVVGGNVLLGLSIIRPVERIRGTISNIAENSNLTIRLDQDGKDELTGMSKDFNSMIERFQGLITGLHSTSSALAAAAQELEHVSENVTKVAGDQEQQTNMIATAITQMSSAIQEVARHAQEAAGSAQEADEQATSGSETVNKSVKAIEDLTLSVQGTAERLQILNDRAAEITEVVQVIENIAEQTNLLALNAAIEAARAGEQGRGFAVVADEVRNLAANTKQSTSTIHDTTQRLLRGATEAMEAMEVSQTQAGESVELSKHSGEAFSRVSTSVSNVADLNIQISTATEEQASVAEDVSKNVNHIADSVRDVVTGASQCSSSSEELARLAADLQQQVEAFKVA
ncbi:MULTISPECIES: methyl-accepting chemotaxis protein [Gammaproteobacteria]|uniref:HAMP domain-containing methyl-accepting chemotaxis protein n=1 Tax=Gammaproteobacteria TaxID=1236 RepID=UPI000DD03297|nr:MULTISPECIES: methyl-accepting chemotaxis protein [Gammaproteobacteria]RTE85732.1 methyl-accepting chemotaxis protein [Aliidiomarina sp. B3213]TCZ90266.1 methyl-accepting chemotaxis protein [Lysobacter sp. N42]